MQRKFLFSAAALGIAILTVGWLVAQEKGASARAKDEEAVKAAAQQLAKAFESGNEKALTALFTEEAEYVDEDSDPVQGREALAKAYKDLFADRKEVKAQAKTEKIRFLGKDTAIEEGTFTVTAKDSSPNKSRYSALHVRQEGKWLIALLKEWADDEEEQPKLEDLSWLIGTWETAGPEMTARTTYSWTANKAFIRADFTITSKKEGEKPTSGTQVIGVDPAVGQIRAWLFGSDGGIGESTWSRDGQRWTIESIGTLADGEHTSAVNFMAQEGKDAFTWKSVERHLAGERLPDIATVTVKRVADANAAAGGKGK
jgi:uncharacterized protein (TIGR02246 family)